MWWQNEPPGSHHRARSPHDTSEWRATRRLRPPAAPAPPAGWAPPVDVDVEGRVGRECGDGWGGVRWSGDCCCGAWWGGAFVGGWVTTSPNAVPSGSTSPTRRMSTTRACEEEGGGVMVGVGNKWGASDAEPRPQNAHNLRVWRGQEGLDWGGVGCGSVQRGVHSGVALVCRLGPWANPDPASLGWLHGPWLSKLAGPGKATQGSGQSVPLSRTCSASLGRTHSPWLCQRADPTKPRAAATAHHLAGDAY